MPRTEQELTKTEKLIKAHEYWEAFQKTFNGEEYTGSSPEPEEIELTEEQQELIKAHEYWEAFQKTFNGEEYTGSSPKSPDPFTRDINLKPIRKPDSVSNEETLTPTEELQKQTFPEPGSSPETVKGLLRRVRKKISLQNLKEKLEGRIFPKPSSSQRKLDKLTQQEREAHEKALNGRIFSELVSQKKQ